jgi:putative colanic acid biosynthesis acetyltransferase WcaB
VRQGVTIGNKTLSDGSLSNSPVIGNNVELGASVIILGEITIGHNVTIGAGTVVTNSITDNKTVVGTKFRELAR